MSTINLLPEDYLRRRDQQRANVLCLILFGVVMAGVVGSAVVSEQNAVRTRREYQQVSEEYRRAGELIGEMQQLEAKKKEVVAKAQMAAELLERVPRSYLLACLTNALPPGSSLTNVKLNTVQQRPSGASPASADRNKFKSRAAARGAKPAEEAPQPKAPPPQVTVEVTGLAQTDVQVAQFISTMQANPLMKSAELVFSEQKDVDGMSARRFQVTLELKPDAQVEVQTEQAQSQPAPSLAAAPTERAQ